jgi:hypothetical protein
MKKLHTFIFIIVFTSVLLLNGCELIGDIFEAGFWLGMIVAFVIIFLVILFIVRMIKRIRK